MDQSRIAELLEPFLAGDARLTATDLADISTYIDILLRWNARINLTAIRVPEEVVTRHFGESLFAARHLFPSDNSNRPSPHFHAQPSMEKQIPAREERRREEPEKEERDGEKPEERKRKREEPEREHAALDDGGRAALQRRVKRSIVNGALAPAAEHKPATLADVGSGAGFPGIPIKLWAPQIELTLIESNQKKATFLREVARALILTDINITTARAETLHAQFDVVTLRAVERFESILPVAASLVAHSGRMAVLIGIGQIAQTRSLLPAFEADTPLPIPHSSSRTLLICRRMKHDLKP